MFVPLSLILALAFILAISLTLLLWWVYHIGRMRAERKWQHALPEIRRQTLEQSKHVLRGQVAEQFAPFMPDFPFRPKECHFLGAPVDFLVLDGLDGEGEVSIGLVEIKSGQARLTPRERRIKEAVEAGRFFWYEYRKDGT